MFLVSLLVDLFILVVKVCTVVEYELNLHEAVTHKIVKINFYPSNEPIFKEHCVLIFHPDKVLI
jgi:hypothetical protein